MRRAFALSSVVLLFSLAALAQVAGGLGSISGIVRDPSGAAVPGAKVVVLNGAKGISREATTTENGYFSAPALAPSTGYKVTVNKQGFAPFEASEITLAVGANVDLSLTLKVGSVTEKVNVTAEMPLVEDTKTNVSQVVTSKEIMDLPINGRRVDSFVLLTPGVTADGTFGLLSFRGVAGHNSFLVDGNDTTDQFYNENAGRTRIASQISQDAVQEFQVVSANMSAEYGRAMGGIINTVTKSGSNDVHGSAFWFFRNRTLDSRPRYSTINPSEVRHQAGATIGGRLIKDKLFYFASVEFTRRNFPLVSSYIRAGIIDTSARAWIGCAAPATPAQCQAINVLLPRYFGTIPRSADQGIYLGKLDYRANDKNTFSVGFNYQHFLSPNGIQTGITNTGGGGINGNGDDSVRVRNGRFDWTYVPKSNLVNEFRWGWSTDRQADTFDNAELGQGLGLLQTSAAGVLLGPANYLPRIEPNERRFQYVDNASWTRGSHNIKFGVDIASSRDYTYFISNQFGNYNYQTVTAFAQDFTGNTTGAKHWQSYSQTFGRPIVDATINDYGFYLEDQWHATSKLTVNIGARYEYAQLPQPPVTNPDYPQTGHISTGRLNLAPRLGLAYRLNDKTVLRAGYGIFHARFPGSLIDNLWTNNGIYQTSVSLAATQALQLAAGPVFPNVLSAPPTGGSVGASNIQFAAPNLKTPYSEQGEFAIERELTKDLGLTVSYIWSRGLQLGAVRDLNLPALSSTTFTYTIGDANGSPVGSYTTPMYLGKRPDTRYGSVNQDENGINSYYNGLAVQLHKRLSHGLLANVAYTWAHEIDDGQGGGSGALFFSSAFNWTYNGNYRADMGSGQLDQRHRLVGSFVWMPTITKRTGTFYKYAVNNWQFSGIVSMQSGRPSTAQVRLSDTPVTGMFSNFSLNGSGLNGRVPFWPVNSLYTPPQYRADVRISKVIPIGEKARALYFNFEIFNVSNTIADTSISTQAYTEAKGLLTLTPTAYGVGIGESGFPDGTQARRMQVSVRLVF